jgi:hypothetical protein
VTPLTLESRVVVSPDQVSTGVEDDVVVLSLADSTYYGLNPVGARIWELLAEPTTVGAIVERLMAEYEVERQECETDVIEVVGELVSRGLVREGSA